MDDDRQRRENILNIILIGSIVMLTVLDAIVLFYSIKDGNRYKEMSFVEFSSLPAFFVFLYGLSRKGYSVAASYLLVAAYFISNSYAAYRWGVMLQVVILAYSLIIVMATILRGSKFGFVTTAAIAAYITPLWYAQFHKILPIQKQQLRSADGVVFVVLYFLIMIVAWLYNREIEKSLARARTSEAALKLQRDLLEITVQERTEELRQAQFEKLEQLNRFAELGQLSSGLFHDVFNLMNALSLRSENSSNISTDHMSETTKQINNFTQAIRKQLNHRDQEEQTSLTESINHVIQLLSYKATKEKVTIEVKPGQSQIDHFDSPFRFHQIMLNLILNAIESFETLGPEDARKRTISIDLSKHNNTITLIVADNGCGMSPETQAKIFDRFFTTKDSSKGTGIGLATIKKIIEEDLHGSITVSSELAIGSTFTITFPLKHAPISMDNRQST